MENDLTVTQQKAIRLLLVGTTVAAAARELDIDRTTIYVWRKSNPYFSYVLNRAQSIQQQALQGDLQDLAATAIDSIRDILTSPDTSAAIRLRAARRRGVQNPDRAPRPVVYFAGVEIGLGCAASHSCRLTFFV